MCAKQFPHCQLHTSVTSGARTCSYEFIIDLKAFLLNAHHSVAALYTHYHLYIPLHSLESYKHHCKLHTFLNNSISTKYVNYLLGDNCPRNANRMFLAFSQGSATGPKSYSADTSPQSPYIYAYVPTKLPFSFGFFLLKFSVNLLWFPCALRIQQISTLSDLVNVMIFGEGFKL
jgi:hypothetical protein